MQFDVSVYFVTYDDEPQALLEWARRRARSVFLVPHKDSTQFGTAAQGLARLPAHDFYAVSRTDIKYSAAFASLLRNVSARHGRTSTFSATRLSIINKERNDKGKPNDVWMLFPHHLLSPVVTFFRGLHAARKRTDPNPTAHGIQKVVPITTLAAPGGRISTDPTWHELLGAGRISANDTQFVPDAKRCVHVRQGAVTGGAVG